MCPPTTPPLRSLVAAQVAANLRFTFELGPPIRYGPWYKSSVGVSHDGFVATVTLPATGSHLCADVTVRVGVRRYLMETNLFPLPDWHGATMQTPLIAAARSWHAVAACAQPCSTTSSTAAGTASSWRRWWTGAACRCWILPCPPAAQVSRQKPQGCSNVLPELLHHMPCRRQQCTQRSRRCRHRCLDDLADEPGNYFIWFICSVFLQLASQSERVCRQGEA